MLEESLVAKQIFLPVKFTIELSFLNSSSEASMMYEVSTVEFPQECLLLVRTHDALQLFYLDVQFFTFDDIPSSILAEVARQRCSQKVEQSSTIFQLGPDEPLLAVLFFLHLAVLAFPPLLFASVLADEGVLDVPAQSEAALAQSDIFAVHAFVHSIAAADLSELAAVTVVVELFADLLVDLLFLQHVLFLLDLPDDISWLFITTEGALDDVVVLHFVLGPLAEALEVEGVAADGVAGGCGIALDDLHLADGTEEILVLVVFFDDDIFPQHFDLGVLEKLLDLVLVDPSVGDDVSEFLVVVFVAKQKVMVFGEVEDVGEDAEGVEALIPIRIFAGAFQLIPDGYFEFGAMDVLKDEARPSRDSHDIILLLAKQQVFYFLYLQLKVLLCQGF